MHKSPARRSALFCIRRFLFLVGCGLAGTAGLANGQALDTVDVASRGADTEISVRFSARTQYLRHAPAEAGQSVRIYVQLLGLQSGDLVRETKRIPGTDRAPAMTISFPELDNSLLVSFERPTRYSVRAGSDGRSISILLPATARE